MPGTPRRPNTTPTGPDLSRRQLLEAGAAATALATLAGTPAMAAGQPDPAAGREEELTRAAARMSPHARRAYAFLDAASNAYPASGALTLAQSYADQAGLFSTAFTYDNTLTILAYLAAGRTRRAAALGDALLYAQSHDPEHGDGRLRQAYNVGPYTFYDGSVQSDGFVRADGTANVATQFGFTGTAVGDMAWAAIALLALGKRIGTGRHLTGAVRLGEWIDRNARSSQPLGGYRLGVDGANRPVTASSTEHNIDVVALFGQLDRLTDRRAWRERRAHARLFVERMWEPVGGYFYTGTNDGSTVNRSPVPADVQAWSYLALAAGRPPSALDWAADHLRVLDTPERRNSTVPAGLTFEGITFSSASLVADEDKPIAPFQPKPDRSGVWFEGNGQLAAALRQRGGSRDEAAAARLLGAIEAAQETLGAGQTIGGSPLPERCGVVSASSPLDTGFGFGYYPYRHTGATAWYLLAHARANPLAARRPARR